MPQATLKLVLSIFLGLVGVISFYRASLARQLHWPPWIVLIVLLVVVAAMLWLLVRPRAKVCTHAGGGCCSKSSE
jgi:hypothetical protein